MCRTRRAVRTASRPQRRPFRSPDDRRTPGVWGPFSVCVLGTGVAAGTPFTYRQGSVPNGQLRMFTALDITNATVRSDANDCTIINNFAQAVSGIVSVGLNAVALVNDV